MSEIVSKELYIEVFKPDCSAITLNEYYVVLEDEVLYLRNRHTLFDADEICVYKAQHKCKEWAYDKGYYISSKYYSTPSGKKKANATIIKDEFIKPYTSTNESYATFKACQWILDNKEK